jgi:hypothetical protein
MTETATLAERVRVLVIVAKLRLAAKIAESRQRWMR